MKRRGFVSALLSLICVPFARRPGLGPLMRIHLGETAVIVPRVHVSIEEQRAFGRHVVAELEKALARNQVGLAEQIERLAR